MNTDHIKSISYFLSSGIALVLAQVGKLIGQLDESGSFNMVEKYIKEGGTALSIVLLLVAVIYLVKENRAQGKRIEDLHQKQIEETAKSTEARIGQNTATEQTNKVTGDLAAAVSKLADKVNLR